jgi:hypothetical protein
MRGVAPPAERGLVGCLCGLRPAISVTKTTRPCSDPLTSRRRWGGDGSFVPKVGGVEALAGYGRALCGRPREGQCASQRDWAI